MIGTALPVPGYEFVERAPLADRHHVEARLAKRLQVAAGVGQEIYGPVPGRLLGCFYTRCVVGAVTLCGPGSIDPFGPDDVGVTVPGGTEGVHEGEIPPPSLYQHHVPERAPVLQNRSVPFHVAGHGFDRPSCSEVTAAVVRPVGLVHPD